jgi:hypothetical protein
VQGRIRLIGGSAAKIPMATLEQDKWLLKQNSAYEFALINICFTTKHEEKEY